MDKSYAKEVKEEKMCPRFSEPVPLEHPIPVLMEALDKVRPPSHLQNSFCLDSWLGAFLPVANFTQGLQNWSRFKKGFYLMKNYPY